MRIITIHLDDEEMAQLEAIARARHVEPAEVLKAEALKIAAGNGSLMSEGPYSNGIAPPKPIIKDAQTTQTTAPEHVEEDRRRERLSALMRSHGIFAGEPAKPKDGLVYQEELRAEWQ